jgi:uncharacterized RDD family membrane protein YckC
VTEDAASRVAHAAGFWRRFASSFIDGVAISVIGGIANVVFGGHSDTTYWLAGGRGFGLVVGLVYFTAFHGRTGQTPGNAALGIRVVDLETGEVIGYGRAFIRWLVSIVSAIVILLGYFWMLWDGKKQTWHDKAASSIPVNERRPL